MLVVKRVFLLSLFVGVLYGLHNLQANAQDANITKVTALSKILNPEHARHGPPNSQPATQSIISSDKAIALAINDLKEIEGGYRLKHPRYSATFTKDGVEFVPRRGGPEWRWELTSIHAEAPELSETQSPDVHGQTSLSMPPFNRHQHATRNTQLETRKESNNQLSFPTNKEGLKNHQSTIVPDTVVSPYGAGNPQSNESGIVQYERVVQYDSGKIIEQYISRKNTIEQQFIIPEPLALNGADLVIEGKVDSAGAFETTSNGWLWRTNKGVVSLGDVRVFDANGSSLQADMTVTAQSTRISISGTDLTQAAYPVTIDPEIGTNDFRISDAGGTGDAALWAYETAVAYNSTNNEYLVVWSSDDTDEAGIVDDEQEIFGQRINAATGAEVGTNDFRISDAGGNGNAAIDARGPAVAYNSTNNEYLVGVDGR